jgi:hypothetical protein
MPFILRKHLIFTANFWRVSLYNTSVTVVCFACLSDRTKRVALERGFSPAIDLPRRIYSDYEILTDFWILRGETLAPVYRVWLDPLDLTPETFISRLFQEELPIDS